MASRTILPTTRVAVAAPMSPPAATPKGGAALSSDMIYADLSEGKETKERALPGTTLPDTLLVAPALLTKAALETFPGTHLVRSSMKREMNFVVGSSYQVASTASGKAPNTSISNDLLASLSDFLSLCALFDEYFVNSFKVVFTPVSRYEKNDNSLSGQYVDFPLHVASIQHGAPLYTSHDQAANNAGLLICNTADPWSYTWKNTESRRSTVLTDPSNTSVAPTQSWCRTTADNASVYTGAAQIIGPQALGGFSSLIVGTVTVRWDLTFRSRK